VAATLLLTKLSLVSQLFYEHTEELEERVLKACVWRSLQIVALRGRLCPVDRDLNLAKFASYYH